MANAQFTMTEISEALEKANIRSLKKHAVLTHLADKQVEKYKTAKNMFYLLPGLISREELDEIRP